MITCKIPKQTYPICLVLIELANRLSHWDEQVCPPGSFQFLNTKSREVQFVKDTDIQHTCNKSNMSFSLRGHCNVKTSKMVGDRIWHGTFSLVMENRIPFQPDKFMSAKATSSKHIRYSPDIFLCRN